MLGIHCLRRFLKVLSCISIFCKAFLTAPMGNAINHLYEFGPFQLNPAERLLLRGFERIDLPPGSSTSSLCSSKTRAGCLKKPI